MTLADTMRRYNLRAGPPRLILVTDDKRLPDPAAAIARLPPGAAVLLRHYASPQRAAQAKSIAALCRRHRLYLLVAGPDWRLAARVGADGLHWPEGMAGAGLGAAALGWRRRRRAWLTCAAHSPAALARARRIGADAALLSPVLATASHPGAAGIGRTRFGLWARRAGVAVLALGGINARTWPSLAAKGAWGAAAIDGLA